MSETVKIKIAKIGRKEMPSKFKEGETYSITTVLDEVSGRKGAAMGKFADGWKIGDTVEGIWEKRTWKDKDGFAQESWNIKNPNATTGGKGGSWGPRKATIVDSYTVAAALAPILFKDKKTIKLDDISALADALMKKFGASVSESEKKAVGADVDLNKEEVQTKKDVVKKDSDFDVVETVKTETAEATEEEDDEEVF